MAVSPHSPIFAYGIENTHYLAGGSKPDAGDTALVFDNTSSVLAVNDPIFCWDEAFNNIQFLGLCTAASDAGISVAIPLQTTPITGLWIWEPTEYAYIKYGVGLSDGITRTYDRGVLDLVSGASDGIPYKFKDSAKSLLLDFVQCDPTDYAAFVHLFESHRRDGLDRVAMGWYDKTTATYKVDKLCLVGAIEARDYDQMMISFSAQFLIEDTDAYVAT